jgi:hypothetical protein
MVNGREESALACYWVTDGVDRCRVGFLPKHQLKKAHEVDGKLAQITSIFDSNDDSPHKRKKFHRNNGCAEAAIIGRSEYDREEKRPSEEKEQHISKRAKVMTQFSDGESSKDF